MAKTVLFGSSLVRRLEDFCRDNNLILTPGTIRWYGKGGLRTDRLHPEYYKKMLAEKADVAFVHVGGNDITPQSTPREIFNRIADVVGEIYAAGARRVVVAEILPRSNFSKCPGLTGDCFESQRKKLNKQFSSHFKQDFIRFPRL